jgi:hypothetical protein
MSNKQPIESKANDSIQETNDTADRRSFMKGSFMIAGAMAGGAIASSVANAATPQPAAAAPGGAGNKEILVVFDRHKEITLRDLYEAIQVCCKIGGCYNCGLVGFDPRFILRDPIVPLNNGLVIPQFEQQTI